MKNHVRTERKKMKITQQKLADYIQVSRQTICGLEKSRNTPTLELALKISKFFNVRIEELFELDDAEWLKRIENKAL